jgi:hypothetical protein
MGGSEDDGTLDPFVLGHVANRVYSQLSVRGAVYGQTYADGVEVLKT